MPGSSAPEGRGLTVVMVGPPNVGKSAIFNRLTGLNVGVANYAGTTVEFSVGQMTIGNVSARLVDAPGIYTLDALSDAERVTANLLEDHPDLVVCVIDATNPEPGLFILLQILDRGLPVLACLNRTDLARQRGMLLDPSELESHLDVPTVSTAAVSTEGLEELRRRLSQYLARGERETPGQRPPPSWEEAEQIAKSILLARGANTGQLRERLGDLLVTPWPGLPLAVLIVAFTFTLVVGLGMGLRRMILLPLVRDQVIPVVVTAVEAVIAPGLLRAVVVGEYGFLTKGIEWPFTLVLPYVISFYLAMSIMEDTGYMPRLAALLDGLLKRAGLPGTAIIPLMLGYGCGIPALMATRSLDSFKQRFLVACMVCFSIPCVSQTGAFVSLLAERSVGALVGVAVLSVLTVFAVGLVMDRVLPGQRPVTILEMPDMLLPSPGILVKKVWARVMHYLHDAVPPVVLGVGVAAVLFETGAVVQLGRMASPLLSGWLLLPEEAVVPLMLGIFRRELAVLPLMDMDLTGVQLFTGAVIALYYVPCFAMVAVLSREFGLRRAVGVLVATTTLALIAGGFVARIGNLFLW